MSTLPADRDIKQWGRHLATSAITEKLPRLYYIVDEADPPATCSIVVDSGDDPNEVDSFSLADVVHAIKIVYSQCLVEKGQVGLEFPGEGHIFAQIKRLDTVGLALMMGGEANVTEKRFLPGGRVLYVSEVEPGGHLNGSEAR
ncbi:MAG: hypothetical protein Q9222_003360 [Ikaeria aurantiellina]